MGLCSQTAENFRNPSRRSQRAVGVHPATQCVRTLALQFDAANDSSLPAGLNTYDVELCDDVLSILAEIRLTPAKRDRLRPHYRNPIETYEDQFVHGRGLADPLIISFFDDHVTIRWRHS